MLAMPRVFVSGPARVDWTQPRSSDQEIPPALS